MTRALYPIGFYFLFKDINVNIRTFDNMWDTILQLFQMTLGEFKASALVLHS